MKEGRCAEFQERIGHHAIMECGHCAISHESRRDFSLAWLCCRSTRLLPTVFNYQTTVDKILSYCFIIWFEHILYELRLQSQSVKLRSRGPTKLALEGIPHISSRGMLCKLVDHVIVHVAKFGKARTNIFLKPYLVGFLNAFVFVTCKCRHLLGPSFHNLLLIDNILDLSMPYIIIVAVQFLFFF